ncbi:retrovirus-related pol polyprotein from transposon TNT 1-94, partial [Tanacetum coccineum]
EKVLVITALKDELRKLKGKALVDNTVMKHTIDPEMLKNDVEPITPKLLNPKTAHSAYIKHTQEEAAVLRDLVEHVKSRVRPSTSASGSQPSGNTKKVKILQTSSSTMKNKVEAHPRTVKSSLKNKNNVVKPKGNANVQHSKLNANFEPLCVKCNGCMLSDNHDLCVLDFINDANARAKSNSVKKNSKKKVWKLTGKVVQIVIWYLDSGCSKHMTGDRSQLTNFVNKFLGIVKFRNDHVAKILGYGDYQIGNVTISRVYYIEGLGHNLFSNGKFCDSNLEVAFCQHTCFIHNLEGVDLLTGSRGNNLYTMSLGDMMASSLISRHGLVRGLPKLMFEKDYLCSACAMGKSKKKPHKPKSEDTNQEKLYLLHMDLYGPMRVASVNRKKYILVIVDDYSRFTWVKCLRSKDEAPDFIINCPHNVDLCKSSVILMGRSSCYRMLHPKSFHIRLRHDKTPYELLHDKLPDLTFFYVFGALCYPTNDSENLDFDELTAMASEHSSSGPTLHEMTHVTISSGLVPNPPTSTQFVPPSRTDWDILFQPLFDELLTPPPSVDHPPPEFIAPITKVVAPELAASTGSPSSITIDQDAPSPSNSQTTPKT